MLAVGPRGRKFYRGNLRGLGVAPSTSFDIYGYPFDNATGRRTDGPTAADYTALKASCAAKGGSWTSAAVKNAPDRGYCVGGTSGCSTFLGETQVQNADGTCSWEWFVPKIVVYAGLGLAAFSFISKKRR